MRAVRRSAAALVALAALAAGCSGGVRRTGAAPSPPAAPAAPARSPELLAYVSATEVGLRHADGRKQRLAAPGDGAYGLRWSPDGGTLAWLEVEGREVRATAYAVPDGPLRRSPPVPVEDAPGSLEFAPGLVGLSGRTLTHYDVSGDALHARGVELTGAGEARLWLGGTTAGRLLVFADEQASHYGGPVVAYTVDPGGSLAPLFSDLDDADEGEVRNAGPSRVTEAPDGTLAYVRGAVADRCEAAFEVVARDPFRGGPATPFGAPAPPARAHWLVRSLTYGSDGLLYAVFVPRRDCAEERPARLYVRTATGWRERASDVTWGAASARGTLAVLRAAPPSEAAAPAPDPGRLVVLRGERVALVADAVVEAAWAPAP